MLPAVQYVCLGRFVVAVLDQHLFDQILYALNCGNLVIVDILCNVHDFFRQTLCGPVVFTPYGPSRLKDGIGELFLFKRH